MRIYLLFILLLILGLSNDISAQGARWKSPLLKPADKNYFTGYKSCVKYTTDDYIYFALYRNNPSISIDIFRFDGHDMIQMLHDTSKTIAFQSSDLFVIYKDKFYILKTDYKQAGTRDTSSLIYRWNNNQWESLTKSFYFDESGNGISSVISYHDELYIGGGFDSLDGMDTRHIVRFDGDQFHPLYYSSYPGINHYTYLIQNNDTVFLFGDGYCSAFQNENWLWKFKYTNFYFYESFIFNKRLHVISWQTGNILVQNGTGFSLTGMSVPFESQVGRRSSVIVHEENIYSILDSVYKINGVENYLPRGLFIHNLKNKWSGVIPPMLNNRGVYNYFDAGKLFSFKGKLYRYGMFDTIDKKGEVVRFVAVMCGTEKSISGHIYTDLDSNCSYTPGDHLLKGKIIEFNPGPYYTSSDDSGNYSISLPLGKYSVEVVPSPYFYPDKCGGVKEIQLLDTLPSTLDLGQYQQQVNDVSVSISGNSGYRARWGFREVFQITIKNLGYQEQSVKVELIHPRGFVDVRTATAYQSYQGEKITWSVGELKPGETRTIEFSGRIDTTEFAVYEKIYFIATLIPNPDDISGYNDVDTLFQKVVSSLDPNDKQVFSKKGEGDSILVVTPGTETLEYNIRFENTGNDTAYFVQLIDTISIMHNIRQIEQTGLSHKAVLEVRPCDPNLGRCVLIWKFSSILLPPKPPTGFRDYIANRGNVTFKIDMQSGLPQGTRIYNNADIYFDYNPPVRTNTTQVLVDSNYIFSGSTFILPVSNTQIYPNPFSDFIQLVGESNKCVSMSVLDLTGKIVYEGRVESNGIVNTQNLLPGIYFIRFNNINRTYKIIKN